MIGQTQICRFKNRRVEVSELEMLREAQVIWPARPAALWLRELIRRFRKFTDVMGLGQLVLLRGYERLYGIEYSHYERGVGDCLCHSEGRRGVRSQGLWPDSSADLG